MYVSRIVVRNFRNFLKLDVALKPGVTCVVGENNAGKTNLLGALRLPIDITLSSQYRFLLASDFSAGLDPTTLNRFWLDWNFENTLEKRTRRRWSLAGQSQIT